MTFAVAQISPPFRSLSPSVELHARVASAAADEGAELVLFPELSLTGYSHALTRRDAIDPNDAVLSPLLEVSRRRGIVVVAGAPLSSSAGLHIASLSFLPDGRTLTYTKQFLGSGETSAFAAGAGGALLDVCGTSVGLAVCAEINHPEHVARTVDSGAEVYAASCLLEPEGFENECRRLESYAREHSVAVMMANYSGPSGGLESAGRSAIWDEKGRLVAVAPSVGEVLVLAERSQGQWMGRTSTIEKVKA
jgi:predicted amidohydrolase